MAVSGQTARKASEIAATKLMRLQYFGIFLQDLSKHALLWMVMILILLAIGFVLIDI